MPRLTMASYGIKSCRVTLALSVDEWDKLREASARNGVGGAQYIESILQGVCASLPPPTREPLPEDPGDEPDADRGGDR